MNFRKAAAADIPVLIQLRKKQLVDESQTPDRDIDGALRRFFEDGLATGDLVQWVAEEDGAVVATGGVLFLLFPPSFKFVDGRRGYVTNMYTDPAFRGRGIAAEILRRLAEEARAAGVCRLLLSSSDLGLSVYQKAGFVPKTRWMGMDL